MQRSPVAGDAAWDVNGIFQWKAIQKGLPVESHLMVSVISH